MGDQEDTEWVTSKCWVFKWVMWIEFHWLRIMPSSWLCYWHCWTTGFCTRNLL